MVKYPEGFSDKKIETFLDNFYKISDTPSAHEQYAGQFAEDATLIIGVNKIQGGTDILAFRKSMWTAVSTRHHLLEQVFPFQGNVEKEVSEYALVGTVEYTLVNGKHVLVEWAGKMVIASGKTGGAGPKIQFYQVYIDPTLVAKALMS
ncbi:hypothetical protein V1504DRAFT_478750 [Lipomyces starkeyi]